MASSTDCFCSRICTFFATGVVPVKWKKRCWLIAPYSLVRVLIVWVSLHIIPFGFTDGDLFEKNILGLLGFTYSIIAILLLLDVILKATISNIISDE